MSFLSRFRKDKEPKDDVKNVEPEPIPQTLEPELPQESKRSQLNFYL